jgi:hypothetical protein
VHKALLLVATGFSLGVGVLDAEAGDIRDRDAQTQHDVATGRHAGVAASDPAKSGAADPESNYNLLPGFVQPFGYPLPPYADGNNFGTIHTGR